MDNFFLFTAWPMVPPKSYSWFHIGLSIFGILAAFVSARFLSVYLITQSADKPVSLGLIFSRQARVSISDFTLTKQANHHSSRILFLCGIFLAVSELYKQGFLYTIVNGHSFDWWYFPFQLCSIPMYLGLLYPFFSPSVQKVFATFIQDFGMLGGIMALVQPEGLMHPYWILTIHGFLWHFTLIFMALFCCFCHLSDTSSGSFFRTLPLFFLCCIIATGINVFAWPTGRADMFYISPYYPSLQIVFHSIALFIGIFPGNLVYLIAVCIGAWILHKISFCLSTR